MVAIGIAKNQPFKPDARMMNLPTEAATLRAATARGVTNQARIVGVNIYPDDPKRIWSAAFANKNTSFEADSTMNRDARVDQNRNLWKSS